MDAIALLGGAQRKRTRARGLLIGNRKLQHWHCCWPNTLTCAAIFFRAPGSAGRHPEKGSAPEQEGSLGERAPKKNHLLLGALTSPPDGIT